jgi:hypothetical protein
MPGADRPSTIAKRRLILGFKLERGCVHCDECDPVVLDLHHRDHASKHPKLCGKTNRNFVRLSLEELAAELEKCEVLCANCHRREEARLGYPAHRRGGRSKHG